MGEMTTKPPTGLAASGPAEDPEADQITKEHDEDVEDITVDPSSDVTVEASEDVTIEAVSSTPHPTLRGGGTPAPLVGQRAPTLLGVPVHSLPLPGVTASGSGAAVEDDATRSISYDEEITVLAPSASATVPADPLAALDALDRPSITDDDEEETKVEPAEAAMKAAETLDDVTTALSAQASLEREKALRRSAPPAASNNHGDDLEFADPDAEDQEEEESLDDELDDDDEVISAGGAIEEEEDDLGQDDDDGPGDGAPTATFMKPADTTSLSGLLNPRRPPTGGRDGFGSRLPTPYPPPQTTIPAPSTSPFASRLGPVPTGTPYPGRLTGAAIPAIQVPPPSGKATTETEPGFFNRPLKNLTSGMLMALTGGVLIFGFGVGRLTGPRAPAAGPTVIVAKPTATTATAPAAPVVEPVQANPTTPTEPAAAKPTTPTAPPTEANAAAKPGPTVTDIPPAPSDKPSDGTAESGLWKPATKKPAAPKPHKVAAVDGEEALLKPKPLVDKSPKPAVPKAVVEKAPKPAAAPAAPKPAPAAKAGKKPAKAWVDPFAN